MLCVCIIIEYIMYKRNINLLLWFSEQTDQHNAVCCIIATTQPSTEPTATTEHSNFTTTVV